ncbi:hypothetical protein LUZ62_033180 [Rhynchospora pubera]|uniref:DUF4220 domain-containing protein n=1 Tax=Rhynchospora pubera TaxID=906938 RepID=A0AAV8HVS2_9POAL|nr:hypothetical protein LUZ62_033180 [Rhynchospora pubera]
MQIIKESWKKLWNAEEIRILVLASLCLQFGLVFLSPMRKRTAKKLLILLLWSFYLLADYVAILALGNLLKKQNEGASAHHNSIDLMAFWAPFLLLHLGGPDTITSYSIEDNELWWRHFLGLAFQVAAAFMVLLELLAVISRLGIAASLIFIVGLVKYAERTWALRSASMNQLRDSMVRDPDPGPSYAEFMQEYVWRREAKESAYVKRKDEPPPLPPKHSNVESYGNIYDMRWIYEAYTFFKKFKPLVVDLMLTFKERKDSQTYFWKCSAFQAFKVVEMELSFLYDVFHTKAIHIRCLRGCLWRFVCLGVISFAFMLFLNCEKQGYASADIIISYVLLGGALFMELISLVLIIISDWMIVAIIQHNKLNKLAIAVAKVMSFIFPMGKPRWSNFISQYNLLSFCLGDESTKIRRIMGAVKVKELWDKFIFIHSVCVPWKLYELLFDELKTKSKSARHTADFKELRDCKGEKALQQEGCNHLRWSTDKEFDESILLWHIATDLCFHTHCGINENPETGHCWNGDSDHSDREISLILSNYMLYLLIMQPSMMPAGIGKIRFQDTCAEAKGFFQAEKKGLTGPEAREALLDVETEVDPIEVKGDRSKSVLFDGCRLAKELNLLAEDERWRLVSRVWVEMLGYAVINCKTYFHAKQLSQGGELLTHMWLLMAHMGIGEQYRVEAGHAVATLAFNN